MAVEKDKKAIDTNPIQVCIAKHMFLRSNKITLFLYTT